MPHGLRQNKATDMTEPQASLLGPEQHEEPWRDELQARLRRYKSRRGRRIEGAFTMRFPFPPPDLDGEAPAGHDDPPPIERSRAASSVVGKPVEVETAGIAIAVAEAEPAPEVAIPPVLDTVGQEPATEIEAFPVLTPTPPEVVADETPLAPPACLPPRPRPRRKIIAFPAPAYSSEERKHRLAEPMAPEQLRILDVPEELQAISATPFLDGLLDPLPGKSSRPPEMLELPFPLASTWERAQAGLLDIALLGVGLAIFGAGAFRFLPQPIPVKYLAMSAGAAGFLLWALYQYLFIVYSGRTVGMRAMGIELRSFKGAFLRFRNRRSRVLSLYLSVLSLGMGILWSRVDADSLCWHDRITQTFPSRPAK
jgi:uncharacterized RDD family membrane protein YckC